MLFVELMFVNEIEDEFLLLWGTPPLLEPGSVPESSVSITVLALAIAAAVTVEVCAMVHTVVVAVLRGFRLRLVREGEVPRLLNLSIHG